MVVRLALAPWTARLTLAIGVLFPFVGWVRTLLQAEQAAHGTPVPGGHLDRAVEAALVGWGLLLEHVVHPGLASDQLAGLGRPEAPCGAPVALHLGHGVSWGLWGAGGGPPVGRWRGLGPALGLAGREHRDHVAPVLAGRAVDLGELDEVAGQPLQQPPAELGVGHLTAAEHDGDLDLVALLEEPLDVALLGRVVVRVDLGPHLHLFKGHQVLLAPGFLGLDGLLVLELRVVHQLYHRRAGHRGDLDHVEVLAACHPQRGLGVHHPELFASGADHPDLGGPDPVVDPGFNADATSLLWAGAQTKMAAQGPPPPYDWWFCDDPMGCAPRGEKPSLLLCSDMQLTGPSSPDPTESTLL